jgi:GntR family transcriptional regulator
VALTADLVTTDDDGHVARTALTKERIVFERRTQITAAVRDRIVSGLHLGTLAHQQRLPSSRDVAQEFGVAPRIAMAAYRELERDGLVEVRPRSGIYLASSRATSSGKLTQSTGWVVEHLMDGISRGVAPIQLPERVRSCLETLRLRAVCLAANRDQIYSLMTELRDDYGFEVSGVEVEQLWSDAEHVQVALREANLLVTIALHAPEVQRRGRELGKPCILVTLRPELMTETRRRLAQQPLYFVATDPRFEDALRRLFEPTEHAGNVRLIVLGRDDPASIPAGAPTYFMRSALDQLGETALTSRRIVPAVRVFSSDTARELLTFIVRANIAAMASSMT